MDNFHPEPFVERCLTGNAQAFEPLVRHYQNAAFATALRYVRSQADAQDIVQDAFVAAYCRLGQLRDKGRFGGWLMHIVANRCKGWLRDHARTQPLDSAETALEDSAAAEYAEQMRRLDLQEAINQLPDPYRSAVLMYYLSGLSYREIAELMEVPLSTVRGRLQQGRIRLRQLLDDPDREELAMKPIDVTEQVQEEVCQIATRQVWETIPLEGTEHIVFYCALDTDLEVRQAEVEDAVLEGTLSAIGLTRENARESVEGIEIRGDQVDNFLETGPHEGEVFMGTSNQNENGQLKAESLSSGLLWRAYVEGSPYPWGVARGIKTTDVFPQMQAYTGNILADMRTGLGRATRITVYREKVEDIILPPLALTAEVQKVFRPNNSSLESVHGPVGSASLVLLVPKGKSVTIIRGRQVRAYGLQGSISFIASACQEVADIEGDVELFDSALETARNIRGKLYQRYYRYLGVRWEGSEARGMRQGTENCRLEDIRGGVDIAVGGVQIEAIRLAGRVRIYNRFGQTQLCQDQLAADSRIELESSTGDIRLSLKEALLDKVHLTAFTLCGQIQHTAFKDRDKGLFTSNNTEMMVLSNAYSDEEILAADFMLKSEAGEIVIEKVR